MRFNAAALALSIAAMLATTATASPQMGSCVLKTTGGDHASTKSCSNCQWQCLTNPMSCTAITFDGVDVPFSALPAWDCGDSKWTTASPGLCVLYDTAQSVFDTQEQGCFECLSQCRGDERCSYVTYNYADYARDATACLPLPVAVPSPKPTGDVGGETITAPPSPAVEIPLPVIVPSPKPTGDVGGDTITAPPSPAVEIPLPVIVPSPKVVVPPSPKVVVPPSPKVVVPPSPKPDSGVSDEVIVRPAEASCTRPVAPLPLPADAPAVGSCTVYGHSGEVLTRSDVSCDQCAWQCLTWGTSQSDCASISFAGSARIPRDELAFGLCPATAAAAAREELAPETYGLCVLRKGGAIQDTQMMFCWTCVEQARTWGAGAVDEMVFRTEAVPFDKIDTYCECQAADATGASGSSNSSNNNGGRKLL